MRFTTQPTTDLDAAELADIINTPWISAEVRAMAQIVLKLVERDMAVRRAHEYQPQGVTQ